ncbi:MAG: hypothetical protein IJI39_01285 [Clostridia bacterium]|nr:hypothetical protein [Clostridia bacterium]
MVYDFDMRTIGSATKFLCNFLGMQDVEILVEYISECDCDPELFWEHNSYKVENISLNDVKIWAFHITGSLDDCKEIKQNGLKNLQKVISEDTLISRFFKSYGIIFDINKKILIYNGNEYNIDYNWYKENDYSNAPEKYLEPIAHRVFYDYCIDGFIEYDNVFDYGTDIHKRPEFLLKLSNAFPKLKSMEEEWEKGSKSYKVHFYALIEQIHRFTFDIKETNNELNEEEIAHIKKWLITYALSRMTGNSDEIFIYINDDIDIPPEQIDKCEEILEQS